MSALIVIALISIACRFYKSSGTPGCLSIPNSFRDEDVHANECFSFNFHKTVPNFFTPLSPSSLLPFLFLLHLLLKLLLNYLKLLLKNRAGYGVVKAETMNGRPVIVKEVNPPRGSGVSHQRKLESYHNEYEFYQRFAPIALAAGGIALPQPISLHESHEGGTEHWRFVLEDLRPAFPNPGGRIDHLNELQTKTALKWLARFHALFLRSEPQGLWAKGTYWHLDTRQEELQRISGQWKKLKERAREFDDRLHRPDCAHRTLVHGDAKCENILFSKDFSQCSMYDFQYTGSGLGVQDVVSIPLPYQCQTGGDSDSDSYFIPLNS